jgi:selenocysteine lyase/cysteine desulfurase
MVAPGTSNSRRQDIVAAMTAIRAYEQVLARAMIGVLKANGATIYGIGDEARLGERVPTIAFNIPSFTPQAIADGMDVAGIGIRDGHMYAPRLMKRLQLPMETGCLRVSLVHYNTLDEIARFGAELARIVARR